MVVMTRPANKGKIALLLLPLLLTFNCQWALEVLHPIEEPLEVAHDHAGDGTIIHGPNPDFGHASHACTHSGAAAQTELSGSCLFLAAQRTGTASSFTIPIVLHGSGSLSRAPPTL